MPDYQYQILKAKNGYCEQALWNAVYFKLAPADLHDRPEAMIEAVQKEWRIAASKLKKAKWEPMKGLNVQYARNCPPLGVVTTQTSRPCGKGKLCPFCWGRRVVYKTFHRVLVAGFPTKTSSHSKAELDVLEFSAKFVFPTAEEAARDVELHRNRERNLVPSKGAAVIVTVAPHEKEGVVVRRSGILLVERGAVFPEIEGVRFQRPGRIDKPQLAKSVGFAARYAVELLRSEPQRTAEVMDAISGVRLCSFSGAMYGKT